MMLRPPSGDFPVGDKWFDRGMEFLSWCVILGGAVMAALLVVVVVFLLLLPIALVF